MKQLKLLRDRDDNVIADLLLDYIDEANDQVYSEFIQNGDQKAYANKKSSLAKLEKKVQEYEEMFSNSLVLMTLRKSTIRNIMRMVRRLTLNSRREHGAFNFKPNAAFHAAVCVILVYNRLEPKYKTKITLDTLTDRMDRGYLKDRHFNPTRTKHTLEGMIASPESVYWKRLRNFLLGR